MNNEDCIGSLLKNVSLLNVCLHSAQLAPHVFSSLSTNSLTLSQASHPFSQTRKENRKRKRRSDLLSPFHSLPSPSIRRHYQILLPIVSTKHHKTSTIKHHRPLNCAATTTVTKRQPPYNYRRSHHKLHYVRLRPKTIRISSVPHDRWILNISKNLSPLTTPSATPVANLSRL